MKYFELDWKLGNDPHIPGMDGSYVKEKDKFFKTGEMGPNKFYNHDYEFDYLVPKAFGDPEPEAEIITDYHMWHGRSPRGGTTNVISARFKEVLEQFSLSSSKFYPAKVLFKDKFYPYYVWQVLQDDYKPFIDFDLTEFNNLSNSRVQKNKTFEVKQFSSFEELHSYRKEYWNRKWNFERLVLKSSFKVLDFCMFPIFYFVVSERLKNAIEEAGLIGIVFNELPVPIEFSDEVI